MREETRASEAAESLQLRRAVVGALRPKRGGADTYAAEVARAGSEHVAVRGSVARARSCIARGRYDAVAPGAESGRAVGAREIVHQG